MTVGDFSEALRRTRFFPTNKGTITVELFYAAGSKVEHISEDTARNWNGGNRNFKVKEHFPDYKISEYGLINYLESHMRHSWMELQTSFRQISDDTCIINFDTKEDAFYWSVVNQFQKILGLPLTDEPVAIMRLRFKHTIQENHIEEIIRFPDEYEPPESSSVEVITALVEKWLDESVPLIDKCLDEIKADIIEPFKDKHRSDDAYQLIHQFYYNLLGYMSALQPIIAFSGFAHYPSNPLELSRILKNQYKEVCGDVKNEICGDVEEDVLEAAKAELQRLIHEHEKKTDHTEDIQRYRKREWLNEIILRVAMKRAEPAQNLSLADITVVDFPGL